MKLERSNPRGWMENPHPFKASEPVSICLQESSAIPMNTAQTPLAAIFAPGKPFENESVAATIAGNAANMK